MEILCCVRDGNIMNDAFKIGSLTLQSRLFLGTSQYPDLATLAQCIITSATELVTIGIRRVNLAENGDYSLLGILGKNGVNLLPNTAGCFTAKEAVLTAKLAREALKTDRIKLEVIGDDYTLYPDSVELLLAAKELVKNGFEVYPYVSDDVVICQRLADLGCVCIMPLAAPIGSGRGLQNPYNLELICRKVGVPVIIDAGLGTASDACRALELGASAVLINTAIAKAGFPIQMAAAFREAVSAGRAAHLARRIAIKDCGVASTANTGKIKIL